MDKLDIYKLEQSFEPDFDIMNEDVLNDVKKIMANKLSFAQRRILLIYCLAGSNRKAEKLITTIKFRQIASTVQKSLAIIRNHLKIKNIEDERIIN